MKIRIDIDCTPEEARSFLGLPDLGPMQARIMDELEERMRANLKAMDPETLFKTWMPGGMEGLEKMQKAFWAQFSGGGRGGKGGGSE